MMCVIMIKFYDVIWLTEVGKVKNKIWKEKGRERESDGKRRYLKWRGNEKKILPSSCQEK